MTGTETSTELHFEPTGPGPWSLDPVHFPRPVTRYWAETHPAPFIKGTHDFATFYGMLIDGLQTSYVNGFAFNQPVPVADEEVPARFARATEVFEGKVWRDQLRDWDEVRKPAAIAKHREIQAVDPDALSDEELAAYLERCRDHHAAMITQHMRFTASAVVPTGDFLAHVGDWTGLPPAELLGLMQGSAPVSAGASAQLERLVAAFAADPEARALLESEGDPAATLEALRSRDGETGEAVSGYLDLVGYRLLDGFDISEPTALELPDVLLRAMRIAAEGKSTDDAGVEERIADIRGKVPEEHRAEFDELLGEARLMYRLRDERGVYSDIWASGLMRRAALAAGRRLAARGQIDEPVHAVDATLGEMQDLLAGLGRALGERARSPCRLSRRPQRQGRSADARPSRPAAAGPVRAAAGHRPADAGDRDRASIAVRKLRGRARGAPRPRVRREPRRVRRACAPHLRARRVRPDRPGRRPRHRVDDRGVQHPPAAARCDRHRQRRPALALGDRRARVRDPRRRRDPRGDAADRGRGTRPGRRRFGRGDGPRVNEAVPLAEARETSVFGSKAVGLGEAIREGLPVPPGIALSGPIVEAVASREEQAIATVAELAKPLRAPLAARSSAADEDGADASFAGQHVTLLNVRSIDDLTEALSEIWWSANSDSAITYRQRVGLFTRPSVGVVVQELLSPDSAGVMFTRNPVTGDDERMIEAAWGLGEAVVAGLVIPDNFRIDRDGERPRAHPRPQADRHPLGRGRRHGRGGGSGRPGREPLPGRRPARRSSASSRSAAKRSTARAATSNGRSPTARSTSCSAAP